MVFGMEKELDTVSYIIIITSYSWQSSSQNEGLCIKPKATKFCVYAALFRGPSPRGVNYSPSVELIAIKFFQENLKRTMAGTFL